MRIMTTNPDYIYVEIEIGDGILIDRPDDYDEDGD
tara:strand:+ start:60 stop:164 length:105 start_codon:yes stop_codon:yes gene_type:complete